MKKSITTLILLLSLFGPGLIPQEPDTWQILSLDLGHAPLRRLAGLGLDILMQKEGRLYIVSSPEDRMPPSPMA